MARRDDRLSRDFPMSPRERAAVKAAVAHMRTGSSRRRQADAAYATVLQRTGDRARAEKVRAAVLGQKPPTSALTAKAAKQGKLPSPSLSDTATRGRLEAAGVTPKIPGGGLIGKAGGNIVEVQHQRLFGAVVAKGAELDVTVETRDRAHVRDLVSALEAEGFKVRVLEGADA